MKAFFDNARDSLFDGRLDQRQVDGVNAIISAWAEHGDGVPEHLAYILATAYHETGRHMVPVREGFATSDAQARRIVAGRRYGRPIDGQVYYGRGLVQLTWRANYARAAQEYRLDFVGDPDLALRPDIAARLLIDGLLDGRYNPKGFGLAHYLARGDLQGARMTVNITDKWEAIAGHYQKFMAALATIETRPAIDPAPDAALARLARWRGDAPAQIDQVAAWLGKMPA